MLRSDGSVHPPEIYEPGDDGLARALWSQFGWPETYKTEVPNFYIDESKKFLHKPAPIEQPRGKKKKTPTATKPAPVEQPGGKKKETPTAAKKRPAAHAPAARKRPSIASAASAGKAPADAADVHPTIVKTPSGPEPATADDPADVHHAIVKTPSEPAPATADDDKPICEDELLVRLASQMPGAAKNTTLAAGKKSYTVSVEGLSVQVLLKRSAFYVVKPKLGDLVIPPELEDKYSYNCHKDIHVGWFEDTFQAWDDVLTIARHSVSGK